MRNVFPVLSVLFFTKKKFKTAELFVVSYFWEKQTRKLIHFSTEGMQQRVWSVQTRCELLKEGRTDLVLDIRTAQEFELLMSRMEKCPFQAEESILEALSVYTPNFEATQKLFEKLDNSYILQAIDVQPRIFDALDIEKFCDKGEVLENKVNLLIKRRPYIFCEKVMQQIIQIPPQRLSETQQLRFSYCCGVALDANICMVKEIAYINVIFPNIYKVIRESTIKTGRYFGEYFAHLFPQLLPYMNGKDDARAEDAKIWYDQALLMLENDKVQKTLADVYNRLKEKLSPGSFRHLTRLLCVSNDVCTLRTILGMAPEDMKSEIRRRLSVFGVQAQVFFPFDGWESKYAKKVIEAMISADGLQYAQFQSLPEDLRQFAVAKLEERAQVEYARVVDLENCDGKELCAEAECRLIRRACFCGNKAILSYLEKYSFKEDAFLFLLSNCSGDKLCKQMVRYLVYRRSLTQKEYYALLTSACKDLALFCHLVSDKKSESVSKA